MTDDELNTYLGDDWTPAQRERITEDWRDYERRYPEVIDGDPDDDRGAAALAAICQLHDGTLILPHKREIKAGALVSALYGGMTQSDVHRQTGMSRTTIQSLIENGR
jgi:hypothetical protein